MITATSHAVQKSEAAQLEDYFWEALEMDTLEKEMSSIEFSPNNQINMGTGRTVNACNMCSNSNTTSGCGGC